MSLKTLRLGAIEEIRRNLNRGFLTSHSFDVNCNGADGMLVQVKFKDDDTWTFELLHPKSEVNTGAKWRTIESPGRYFSTQEAYEHEQFNQAYSSIYGWVDRVNEEVVLSAQAHKDKTTIDELRLRVEAAANNLPDQRSRLLKRN